MIPSSRILWLLALASYSVASSGIYYTEVLRNTSLLPSLEEAISTRMLQENLNSMPVDCLCPKEGVVLYDEPEIKQDQSSVEWCLHAQAKYGIRVGRSFGSSSREVQHEWERRHCNDIVTNDGKLRSCNEGYGWKYIDGWLKKTEIYVKGSAGKSAVSCAADSITSVFCRYSNVIVDFSKASTSGGARQFRNGFLTVFGAKNPSATLTPYVPGLSFDPSSAYSESNCDYVETRPAFFMSHDDIYNFGHHMNDVMMVWTMIALSGTSHTDRG